MKKVIVFIPLFFFTITIGFGQKVNSQLKFEQGQILQVSLQVNTTIVQQAMGQAIDFDLDGSAVHFFKITNATDDNSTLHHYVQQIAFHFDGMGQKRSFNSDNENDMNGQFGKPMKKVLDKTYDMIIDTTGKVLMVQPEKIENSEVDERMVLISSMLKDVLYIVQPPQKGSASFFKIFPDSVVSKGSTWTDVSENESGKFSTSYTLTDITDSTTVVDFTRISVTASKAEMMGTESITTMNNKSTGRIILDKLTGIIREKKMTTESNGATEVMGNSLPVTSKTTSVITVSRKN